MGGKDWILIYTKKTWKRKISKVFFGGVGSGEIPRLQNWLDLERQGIAQRYWRWAKYLNWKGWIFDYFLIRGVLMKKLTYCPTDPYSDTSVFVFSLFFFSFSFYFPLAGRRHDIQLGTALLAGSLEKCNSTRSTCLLPPFSFFFFLCALLIVLSVRMVIFQREYMSSYQTHRTCRDFSLLL